MKQVFRGPAFGAVLGAAAAAAAQLVAKIRHSTSRVTRRFEAELRYWPSETRKAPAWERAGVRARVLAVVLVISTPPSAARAEWQLKPFLGATFGGGTTLVDLDNAAGGVNVALGVSAVLIGEIVGVEGDAGYSPGFFQAGGGHLVVSSSASTFTGNLILAAPRRLTQYTLRPYFVGGGGVMRASSELVGEGLAYTVTLRAVDFGGGMTGFLTNRFGLSWDVRYFRSLGSKDSVRGFSLGPEQLSFWRANMALAIRLERMP